MKDKLYMKILVLVSDVMLFIVELTIIVLQNAK